MSIRLSLLAAAALTPVLATASMAEVVSWGGNYLSGNNVTAAFTGQALLSNLDRDGDGNNDDNGFGVAFASPTGGVSIAPTGGNYSGAGAGYTTGPAIYGGYEFIAYDTAAPGEQNKNGVADPATTNSFVDPDVLAFRGRYNANHDAAVDGGEIAGVVLLATEAPLTFGVGSSVDLLTTFADGGVAGRIVLQSGGDFFISNDALAYTTGVGVQWVLDAGEEFYAYDPAAGLNFDQSNPGAAVTGGLENVTAVGFYFENDSVTSDDFSNIFNADVKLEVVDFTANAIPEPASAAVLGAAGLLLAARRQRDTH